MTEVFLAIREFYEKHVYKDAALYVDAAVHPLASPLLKENAKLLADDYRQCLAICSQFVLGTYRFGVYQRLVCPRLGEYVVIAQSYYGSGIYATWNYYTKSGTYGKRIDDAAQNNRPVYASFTELLRDFWANREKYDIHKGTIRGDYHSLPMV